MTPKIALLSLPPLPGSLRFIPGKASFSEGLERLGLRFLKRLQSLKAFKPGYQGILVKNGADRPCPESPSPSTVASLALLLATARETMCRPVPQASSRRGQGGYPFLIFQLCHPDSVAAYCLAAVTGCDHVRLPFSFCDSAQATEGVLQIRKETRRQAPQIWVEVPLTQWLEHPELAGLLKHRLGAYAVIITELKRSGSLRSLQLGYQQALQIAQKKGLPLWWDTVPLSPLQKSPRVPTGAAGLFVSVSP